VLAMAGMSGMSVLILASVIAVLYSACYGFTVEKIAYKPLRLSFSLAVIKIKKYGALNDYKE
jgi:branched-chain amino acid transport system permease protein